MVSDTLGKFVAIPTNAVPGQLLPPPGVSITNQIPTPARGALVPEPVQQRKENLRVGQDAHQFFPSFAPPLAPYLAAQDEFGNSSLKTGALIPWTPIDVNVQRAKYCAAEVGLRYSLRQTIT